MAEIKEKRKSPRDVPGGQENHKTPRDAPGKSSREMPGHWRRTSFSLDDQYVLHKAVWKNNPEAVDFVIAMLSNRGIPNFINELDSHGNTPLHIAAHFGNEDIVRTLLSNGANPDLLSKAGWRPLDEAVAAGSRPVATLIMKASLENYRKQVEEGAAKWHENLDAMPDFYLELNWEFSFFGNWIPFVSSIMPNDVYRIWKKGNSLRLDYTLMGFSNFKITRGNVSFIFTGKDNETPGHVFVLNHDKKTRQDFCERPSEHYEQQIEDAFDYIFAHDICSHLPLSGHYVKFEPKKGWFSSAPSEEVINGRKTIPYHTHGLVFRSLIRSDPEVKRTRIPRVPHTVEEIEKHRAFFHDYFSETLSEEELGEGDEGEYVYNESESNSDKYPVERLKKGLLWSEEKVTKKVRKFEGKVWMAEDFPLKLSQFLSIIDVYSPTNQQLKKVQEFIQMNLPEGFPVRIQIPLFYLLSATMELRHFTTDLEKTIDPHHNINKSNPSLDGIHSVDDLFTIPNHYTHIAEAYIGSEAREMFKVVDKESKH